MTTRLASTLLLVVLAGLLARTPAMAASAAPADEATTEAARRAMAKATDYFTSVSTGGGWAGIWTLDLAQRWGESLSEKANPGEIWVQPPGTPTVGKTLLRAHRVTGDAKYLAAARGAGRALVWGQRQEGGWDHRVDVSHLAPDSEKPERRKGNGAFDDNITQGAIDFLMDLDAALDEPWLDDGVRLGLEFLQKSQFPCGAWPQWYPLRGGYHDGYTFNDNAINDCIRVLCDAHHRYGRAEYLAAAKRGGDFIIASQLAAPQSGWAQQYGHDLRPAWARAFEPPAACSAVTARNIRTLVDLHAYTRDAKYLEPIPAALGWLDRSKLKDGLWARLYEVGTDKPIYGDRDGKVHYTLDEISEERRSGYSWQGEYGVARAKASFERVRRVGPEAYAAAEARPPSPAGLAKRAKGLESKVRTIVAAMDDKGRWVDADQRVRCQTFVAHMRVLCDYVEGASAR